LPPSPPGAAPAPAAGAGLEDRGESAKRIRILYFAELRERRGIPEETIVTVGRTPSALYQELGRRHGFPPPPEGMAVAVNDELAGWDTELAGDDTVVFLTPFGGG